MEVKADDNAYNSLPWNAAHNYINCKGSKLDYLLHHDSFFSYLIYTLCVWMRSKPTRKSTRSLMYGETLAEIITNGRLPAICEKLFYHFQQQRWEKQKWRLIFCSNFRIPLSAVAYPPNTLILLATTKWTFLSTGLKTDYRRIQNTFI